MKINNISVQYLFWSMIAVLVLGTGSSLLFTPVQMFHIINPIAIALGVIIIIVYSPGWIDAWKNKFETITPAHLLTFGVSLNWLGMTIRMGRWYYTGSNPDDDFDQWFYNLGLWISIWAGIFLIGAAQMVTKPYKIDTLIVIFASVLALLLYLSYAI